MQKQDGLKADAVFEGGGVKGIGLVGAVAVAEEKGYSWANLAGTSAGAIVAALLASGYSGAELKQIMAGLDYTKFRDASVTDRIPLVGPIASLVLEKGIYEGKFIEDWIRSRLQEKNVRTFGDLVVDEYRNDARYRFKLRVIASDITLGRMLVLPQDIAAYSVRPEDLDVATAVRMSMSIPFFFEPVGLKAPDTGEVSYIVDGGLLSNFPVWLFDTGNDAPEWPTFGFNHVEPEEGAPHRVKGPLSMLGALFSTMMEAHDARYMADSDFVRTIPIPTLGVKTTEFDLSKERSDALCQSGRQAAEEFFRTWDFATYVKTYRSGKPRVERSQRVRQAQ